MVGPIDTSAFNRLGQFASSPGNGAYCYAELAVSSIAVAETIASTYLRRDDQAEYRHGWQLSLNTKMAGYTREWSPILTATGPGVDRDHRVTASQADTPVHCALNVDRDQEEIVRLTPNLSIFM